MEKVRTIKPGKLLPKRPESQANIYEFHENEDRDRKAHTSAQLLRNPYLQSFVKKKTKTPQTELA